MTKVETCNAHAGFNKFLKGGNISSCRPWKKQLQRTMLRKKTKSFNKTSKYRSCRLCLSFDEIEDHYQYLYNFGKCLLFNLVINYI